MGLLFWPFLIIQHQNKFWWGISWSCLWSWFSRLPCIVQSYWTCGWSCKTILYHWNFASHKRSAGLIQYQFLFFDFSRSLYFLIGFHNCCFIGWRFWCSNFRLWYGSLAIIYSNFSWRIRYFRWCCLFFFLIHSSFLFLFLMEHNSKKCCGSPLVKLLAM